MKRKYTLALVLVTFYGLVGLIASLVWLVVFHL
jgi:hypothetical protein